jgi:RNA polymerase sigma-70 factor, ECF subfamily
MIDEAGLLDGARRRDPEAIAQIFDRYAQALFRYAVRLSEDPAEADQIVGDVFAQLLEQVAAGRGPRSNLRAYLYQITYHVLVDRVRYSSHVSSLDEAINLTDGKTSVAGQIEESELLRELRSAIENGLTEEQQHVIMLRFMEGFSLQETATITGKNVNAVSVLQNRAITKLRQVMGERFAAGE